MGCRDVDLSEIDTVPPVSPVWKVVGWGIPTLILASLVYIGLSQGAEVAGQNLLYWIVANGVPSMIGALVAFAHPVTVVSAFFVAPVTSLTPVIGAGYVCAFLQAYFQPPKVREFETLADDVGKPREGSWVAGRACSSQNSTRSTAGRAAEIARNHPSAVRSRI